MQITFDGSALLRKYWTQLACLLLGLFLGSGFWKGCNKPQPAGTTRIVTTTATGHARPDSQLVAVEIPATHLHIEAQANRRTTTVQPSRQQGSSQPSASSCVDTCLWSGGNDAEAPDSISICHDLASDRFRVDLKLAARRVREVVHFVVRDSIIYVRDSSVTTVEAKGKSMFETALEYLGAALIGFFAGKVLP